MVSQGVTNILVFKYYCNIWTGTLTFTGMDVLLVLWPETSLTGMGLGLGCDMFFLTRAGTTLNMMEYLFACY